MMVFFPPNSSPGKDESLGGRGEFSPPPPYKKSWIEAIQNRIKSANLLRLDNHPLSMIVILYHLASNIMNRDRGLNYIDWAPMSHK